MVLGYVVTTSTQTLISGLNLVGHSLTALCTSVSGQLRSKWGCRQTIIYTTLIGQGTNFTYALCPDQVGIAERL